MRRTILPESYFQKNYLLLYTTIIAYFLLLPLPALAYWVYIGPPLAFSAHPDRELIQMYLQPREHSMDTWQSTSRYAQQGSEWQNIANNFLANNRFRDLYRDWFSEEASPSNEFATLFSPEGQPNTLAIDFRSRNLIGVLLEILSDETSFNFSAMHRAMISGDDITTSYRGNYGLPTFNPFNALCHEEVIRQIYSVSTEGAAGYRSAGYGSAGYVSTVLSMFPVTRHTSDDLEIYYSPRERQDFFNARPYRGNLHYSHHNTRYPDFDSPSMLLPLSGLVTIRITPANPTLMAQWRQQREQQQITTRLFNSLWGVLARYFFGQSNNGQEQTRQEPSIPDYSTPLPIPPGYYDSLYGHNIRTARTARTARTERPSGTSYSIFGSVSCCADSSCCTCYDNQPE